MSTTTPHDIQLELNLREIEVEALRMALAEADTLMDHCDEPTAWRERWAGLLAGNSQSRHELQAKGKHPAPCARFCEATAFNIELRRLRGDLADLSTKTRALCLRAPGWWEETIAADEAARRAA